MQEFSTKEVRYWKKMLTSPISANTVNNLTAVGGKVNQQRYMYYINLNIYVYMYSSSAHCKTKCNFCNKEHVEG